MKKTISIFVISSFIIFGLLAGSKVQAQSFDTGLLASLQSVIESLQAQITALQSQLQRMQTTSQTQPQTQTQSQMPDSGAISVAPQLPSEQSCPAIQAMSVGSRGDEVTRVQTLLNKAGYYPEGIISKYYGGLTRAAVLRFQKAQGLAAIGNIDASTASALSQIASSYLADCGIVMPPYQTAPFTITFPNGGESFPQGSTQMVQWTYDPARVSGSSSISISMVSETGNPVSISPLFPTIISYRKADFAIPISIPVGRYKIVAGGDASDNYFSIISATSTQPSVTVLSPNGGEQWEVGSIRTISWQNNGFYPAFP
ncbi:MAG: peptidoglycan-binding protein, partial [Patescibacteria group bacterium]|nr:peptidoglycan-binding protein [Patescibacteria group bacterium]